MSFSAKLMCDETGCTNEFLIDCDDPDFAHFGEEEAAEAGWFVDYDSYSHYCPIHAAAARAELQNEPEDD